MNEVKITLKFITGTSISDPEDAKRSCLSLLLAELRDAKIIAVKPETGLFSVRIAKIESKPLK